MAMRNARCELVKRVLIVEDDADMGQSLADVLEEGGFHTAVAQNGLQALEQLHAGMRPDLILLDMTMPVMNGWEFRREQRAIPEFARVPVVVLTADGEPRRKAVSIDAQGCLAKPVSIDDLLREIERVCGPPD